MKRRRFLRNSGIAVLGVRSVVESAAANRTIETRAPCVLSTWNFSRRANWLAWKRLNEGARAVDAVVDGVSLTERDITVNTVGYGGLPDREGIVTLDACVMDEFGNAGAVAGMERIVYAAQIARLVKDKTPHVMLVGQGALDFALKMGYREENLLTPHSEQEWKKWLATSHYEPKVNIENHDTISSLALDKYGNLGGVCTTSGLAYKMHGRVGDSPIIGAGLFVDNEFGAAATTGLGEIVMKNMCAFLCVELMRNGKTPQQACEITIDRVIKKLAKPLDIQIGIIALSKNGEIGAYSVQNGFTYTVRRKDIDELNSSPYKLYNGQHDPDR